MENDICPVCGTELKSEQERFSVRYTCPGCGRYERIETDTPASPGRVQIEKLIEPDRA